MPLLTDIAARLAEAPGFARTAETIGSGGDVSLAAPALVRPAVVAAVWAEAPRATLVVVPGEDAAERFARQLTAYLPSGSVLHFPERRDVPWVRTPPDIETVGRRAHVLHTLSAGEAAVVVVSARALLRTLPPRDAHVFEPLTLEAGTMLDLDEAAERLARMGYERVPATEERGQFSVRGGTLDVFPSDASNPVRAELFGDEVESLRRFVPSTQQSIGTSEPVRVYPCREVRLSNRAFDAAERRYGQTALADPFLAHDLELISQGVYFNGIESYLPVFYKQTAILTDYLPSDALVVVAEPRGLFDDMARAHDELASSARASRSDVKGLYLSPAEVDLGGRQRLTLVSLLNAGAMTDVELTARRPEVGGGGAERFVSGVRALAGLGYDVWVAAPDRGGRRFVESLLSDAGVPAEDYRDGTPPPAGGVSIAVIDIPSGYVVPDARLAVVSYEDAFPRNAARQTARAVDPTTITFSFAPGDYVVHATHGIGLFKEMTRKSVLGIDRDYLTLEYAKGDRLYVPVEQLDRVTKYVGPDGGAPKVTRLNTQDWTKATTKARSSAKKLAFDLVDLYARRAAVAGHSFAPDSPWQMEMEAMFPFEETPDQLAAIADVKADMESEKPMDRLVCGDVGYGKTEVAIRAAFKAVQDGRQVMVLCPTTILAQQHYTTFSERFAPFPVRVEVLSRFRTKKQQEEALRGFVEGTVEVLIGTHRLLSRDVAPKDLGLVVIDEEQRFGVEHKEHLKNLREQVDVLALSATPIPRTLQMSLSGVRDMSIIDTPPPNRFPVQVHVGEWDAKLVSDAIRREIGRGGQVYYISNRVKDIDEAVRRVAEAVPEARIGVAHGQMSGPQIERVMESFSACETDVLVATTIVESGIDNPHTNTLVIEDSQRLGLAQLYQLKGRVGRSHVKAYAYFLFSRTASLTEQAVERLMAIRENTELGSGLRVAMRDLEIRGAGSMLGAEQSGQLSAVGFELYAQMLQEALAEVRGEVLAAIPDVRVDLPVTAFLPEEYVADVGDRVMLYRRLAGSAFPETVERAAEDMRARFGEPPQPARDLVAIARARTLAAEIGATSVAMVRDRVDVLPVRLSDAQAERLAETGGRYSASERKVSFTRPLGTGVAEATLTALDAILAVVRTHGPKGDE